MFKNIISIFFLVLANFTIVNAELKKHFEDVGATMSKEWAERAGSRGAAVLAAYK